MRTVEINSSVDFPNAVALVPAGVVSEAFGYLATWAMDSDRYAKATIFADREGCLNATYRDAAGNVTYSLAGILREDGRYSFHS